MRLRFLEGVGASVCLDCAGGLWEEAPNSGIRKLQSEGQLLLEHSQAPSFMYCQWLFQQVE